MAKKQQQPNSVVVSDPANEYLQLQIQLLGRNIFYVDSGAILESFTPEGQAFNQFFKSNVARLVTSTYVVMETVRNLVKAGHRPFIGPTGERARDLALYFVSQWIEEYQVNLICVPQVVFEYARHEFMNAYHYGCDLNDVMSFVIVRGMEQKRIVAKDRHFQDLGLVLYP